MRDEAIVGSSVDNPVVESLLLLLDAFSRQNISYCYWKSTRRLPAVLAGEADLDLLVARPDQHRAQRILLECGFKLFPSVASRDHPAVASFLGYDEPSGLIVHVHLHLRLVLGESLFKNYRLPWEQRLLTRAVAHPTLPVRILDPGSEALLLVVRSCIEARRLDPVQARNWRRTKEKFALDRARLAARVDRGMLGSLAAEFFDQELAGAVADALNSGHAPGHRLRQRVRRSLAAHRSHNALEGNLRRLGRSARWLAGGLNKSVLHLPRPWSRRAPGGGIVVALLGVDGSGKTTVVAAIREWLGSEIDVLPMYFGTGDGRPSLLLLPLKLMVPLVTPLLGAKPKGSSHGKLSGRPPGLAYSLLLMLWSTVLAGEKRGKLLAARRGADRGLVVVADRFPQDEIVGFNDGPLLPRVRIAPRWLRRLEARAYGLARQLPPDLVVKLKATPELIAVREPDMDPAIVRQRIAELQRLSFPGATVASVDAGQPLADVIRAVKREIWRLL